MAADGGEKARPATSRRAFSAASQPSARERSMIVPGESCGISRFARVIAAAPAPSAAAPDRAGDPEPGSQACRKSATGERASPAHRRVGGAHPEP